MLTARLSVMMFLEFFIWGAYFVSMALYISAEGVRDSDALAAAVTDDRGEAAASLTPAELTEAVTERVNSIKANAYTAIPLGAILAPLFLGLLADRLLPAQIVNGILHLIGAVLLWLLPTVELTLFFPVLLLYAVVYMPTLGLTNTVAFHSISESDGNAERQFPVIRVFGTIGWIAAGLLVSTLLQADTSPVQFQIAAIASAVFGLYSFTLPSTPPAMKGQPVSIGSLLGVDALSLLRNRSFATFMVASALLCIPLAFYYQSAAGYLSSLAPRIGDYSIDQFAADTPNATADGATLQDAYTDALAERTGFAKPTDIMTMGQMSEIGFMLLIPFFFRALGTKWMLLIGMVAWVVRYLLFAGAFGSAVPWMLIAGVLLHGICYDFFFVTGQIYVDKAAPPAVRGQAQGLLVLLTQGVGMIIGAQAAGFLANATTSVQDGVPVTDWVTFWMLPAALAGVIAVAFWALFREPAATDPAIEADPLAADEDPTVAVPPTEPAL